MFNASARPVIEPGTGGVSLPVIGQMLCDGEKNSGAADISPRTFHKGPPAAVRGRADIRGLLAG
jgi:hypothetical protein